MEIKVVECLLSFGAESYVLVRIFACYLAWVCNLVAHIEGGASCVEDFWE